MTASAAAHLRRIDVAGKSTLGPIDQERPDLGYIRIAELVINDRYQRPLTEAGWRTISRIAADFRWSRFSPALVAPLPDGQFAVIDGPHRIHAAAMRGIDKVPCMMVDIDLTEQAQAFVGVNDQITRITIHHVFRAAMAAREAWAVQANAAVSAADCKLMTSNASTASKQCGEVYCIGLIKQLVTAGHGQAVTAVLKALKQIDGNRRVPLYSDYILRPLMMAVATHPKFLGVDLAALLQVNDPFAVLNRARREDGSLPAKVARGAFFTLLARQVV